MLLKDQIATAKKMINVHEQEIQALKAEIAELEAKRHSCAHEFTKAPAGYEHEGGVCLLCGINEVYAASQKIGQKYQGQSK